MKKGDFVWVLTLLAVVAFLVLPITHDVFIQFTARHPYYAGFIKFLILATMGELLAIRIVSGIWKTPPALVYRSIIWGLLGMGMVLMFECFAAGTKSAMAKGLLPGNGSPYAFALFVSIIMNSVFGTTFMALHRITDTYLDLKFEYANAQVTFKQVLDKIDWTGFVSFVVCRTIPFFWIPAHTITFSLPPEYRVLMAAFLGIALGGILGFAKKRAPKVPSKAI
ncbi:MAG: hypothetical protein H6Q68_3606 [Firmicutes bacterium]|nr:hypothetical protein [Bacillota bacterium]